MSTKKLKKSEITRAYIYEGAMELFALKGFEQTTIRDLTEKLNISLGSLYYHFKSKDDVLIQYFKKLQEETTLGTEEVLAAKTTTHKKVLKIMEVNLALLKKNPRISRDLINSTSNLSHPLSPFGKELRPQQEHAMELFRIALSRDHKPGEYLDCLAFLYWFYHLGICLMWANDTSENNKNTTDLINITYPLVNKVVALTRIGLGKKLLLKLTQLLKAILLKES